MSLIIVINRGYIVIGLVKDDECKTVRHCIGNRNQCMIRRYTFAENLAKELGVSTVYVRETKDSTHANSKYILSNVKMGKRYYVVEVFESDIEIL